MIGLPTQQVNDIIIMESGIQYHHHYTHVYRLLHNGVLNRKYQERYVHVNTASSEKEKEKFKKSKGNSI
jgi:Xaa-Pro aminopeptidase